MLGVVFQHLPCADRVKNFIQGYILLGHLLLGMLSNANVLRLGLSLYSMQRARLIIRILTHASHPQLQYCKRVNALPRKRLKNLKGPGQRRNDVNAW